MIRVIIDTNVLISGLLHPEGLPAKVLLIAIGGTAARFCVSGEVYSEYEEVIRRPRFKRSESEIASTLRAVREIGLWVKPAVKVRACSDPDDNAFLECAQAARAQYLVTGNVKHFPGKWGETFVVTPHEFLDAIAEIQDEPDER